MMIPLNALGLILDIFGVCFIGWSFFYNVNWKTLTRRRRETMSAGVKIDISKSENIPSYIDGVIGTSLLLLGLVLQLWGVWTKKEVALLSLLPGLVLLLILLSPLYFWRFRGSLTKWRINQVLGKESEARKREGGI